MEASPSETISLTEYYPCRTDKAPADSRGTMMAGGQRSEQPVDLEARRCSDDDASASATGHGGILERMHTVSSTETSGYVDAASSPTAPISSPTASSVAPCPPGEAMTDDAGPFYPGSADGLRLLPQKGASCSRRPDGAFTCDQREGEGQRRPGVLCRPMYQRRDVVDGKAEGRGGQQGRPGAFHHPQGQSVAFRDDVGRKELLKRNRKEEDDDEDEEEEADEDDEEEETCSSSEEDGDYWQREDSSMFTRRSSKTHHQRSTAVGSSSGHRTAPSPADRPTTDQAHDQGQGHGQFLGKATQSAWLKWSHERRASFKRRVEFMEQRQTELQRVRLSSPIRKARKESVRFVAKELEQEHLAVIDPTAAVGPEDETSVYGQHPAFPFDIPPSTKKKKKVHCKKTDSSSGGGGGGGAETRLSLAQWNTLVAFWEHRLFVKLRCCGLLLGLAALACGVSSLANNQWATYESQYNLFAIYR